MGKANREGLNHAMGLEDRKEVLKESSENRWKEFQGEPTAHTNTFPESLTEEEFNQLDPVSQEFIVYYSNSERGHHYLGKGAITFNSKAALMNFTPYTNLDLLAGRPLLIVSGEESHSREFSEDAYAHAYEPKELYLLPDTSHTDLYDQKDKIPFDKLGDFFKKSLNE
ncbi:alpha/beta hydrolase [Salicibibacter kimchii]|nr:alpha/beta hydrolase [Salicibibacter kimchii]